MSRACWIRMAMLLGEKKVCEKTNAFFFVSLAKVQKAWKTLGRQFCLMFLYYVWRSQWTWSQCRWKAASKRRSRCQCRSHRCHCRRWTWWSLSSRSGNQCAVKEKHLNFAPACEGINSRWIFTRERIVCAKLAGLTLSVFIRFTSVFTCATMSLKRRRKKNQI